jgi:HEAT repeat protein
MSATDKHLFTMFDADRQLLSAEEAFLNSGAPGTLLDALEREIAHAEKIEDDHESILRIRRIVDLAAQIEGGKSVAILLRALDHGEPSVRVEAGEALLDVAYERFKEVATAVEKLLDKKHDGTSMEELPFILAEIFDPDTLPLIMRFLGHPSAEVVASAIEATVQRGDPLAIRALERLLDDKRRVSLPDVEDAEAPIGDLAADAIAALAGDPDEEDEA